MHADNHAAAALAVVRVAGASVSTMGGLLASETLSATDSTIARVDELQFDLGEGPCWDALAAGRPVMEPDLLGAPRRYWPAFSPALQGEPIAALYAFPMRVGPFHVGAIDLYDIRPRELGDQDVANVIAFAAVTGRKVLRRALQYTAIDDVDSVPSHARRIIHQATGFVIAQLGVTADEAELLIRASAFAEGRPMREIAEEFVSRRRRFTVDGAVIEEES
jgi:GAF domain-containing protein